MKKLKHLVIYILNIFILAKYSFALDYGPGGLEEPSVTGFLVPIARIFYLFLMLSGAILTGMIVYGAIKLAMSLGDPLKMKGARGTLTYAVFGFGIIVFFFGGVFFLANALGIEFFGSPNEILERIAEGIDNFMIEARVFD